MLQLYTWKTPNGQKVPILLEELGIEYEIHPINISSGEQKTPEYLAINPNNKIPALVVPDADGGPLTIFESGAILMYLAETSGKFMPSDLRGKYQVIEWLMFQMAGVGPMFGQLNHFIKYAPERVEYAITRYSDETNRLLKVMNTRLGEVPYLAGDYSIADISTWPWVKTISALEEVSMEQYPNVQRWFAEIGERPAVVTALQRIKEATHKI